LNFLRAKACRNYGIAVVLAKNEKADLTPAERNELKKITTALLKSYRGEP
jgi:hypothetical protein